MQLSGRNNSVDSHGRLQLWSPPLSRDKFDFHKGRRSGIHVFTTHLIMTFARSLRPAKHNPFVWFVRLWFFCEFSFFQNWAKQGNNDESDIIEELSGIDLQIVIGFPLVVNWRLSTTQALTRYQEVKSRREREIWNPNLKFREEKFKILFSGTRRERDFFAKK